MDFLQDPAEFVAVSSALLLLLLCTQQSLEALTVDEAEDELCAALHRFHEAPDSNAFDAESVARAALHSFRLCSCVHFLGEDLGYWVKPRSTTSFSRFLLEQFEEDRWVKLFRMTKASVFALADILKPNIIKKDTRYRLAIPVVVRVACTLFKLTQGASLLVCSEMFAVGRSSVSMLLRQVVGAINIVLQHEISWPRGPKLLEVESDFRRLCSLPGVLGAIDGTHVAISKPSVGSSDYFYFKSGGFTINCQAVVDSGKRFLDLFLGMPGSTNDSRVLRRSTLFQRANSNTLWDSSLAFEGFSPFLLADGGYPCLSWLMVPHGEHGQLSVADALFNRKHHRGRGVVENAFAILKQTFRELLHKSDLHVTFVPDVITACALLHNMLLRQSSEDVECFLNVLRVEGFSKLGDAETASHQEVPQPVPEISPVIQGLHKRRDLGLYLAARRGLPLS